MFRYDPARAADRLRWRSAGDGTAIARLWPGPAETICVEGFARHPHATFSRSGDGGSMLHAADASSYQLVHHFRVLMPVGMGRNHKELS